MRPRHGAFALGPVVHDRSTVAQIADIRAREDDQHRRLTQRIEAVQAADPTIGSRWFFALDRDDAA